MTEQKHCLLPVIPFFHVIPFSIQVKWPGQKYI